jgi:hypothetical protein
MNINIFREGTFMKISTLLIVILVVVVMGIMTYCNVKTMLTNMDSSIIETIHSQYPGAEITDIDCEYEDEDGDQECDVTFIYKGRYYKKEVDCVCGCISNNTGCRFD